MFVLKKKWKQRFYPLAPFYLGVTFIPKSSSHWMLACAMKISGWIVVASLIVLPILWILNFLHLFTLILAYEALFTLAIGVFQILSSYIYRKDSIPYRWGGRTGWFDFRKFAELKPKERQRYRQEGTITAVIGFIVLTATITIHFSVFY